MIGKVEGSGETNGRAPQHSELTQMLTGFRQLQQAQSWRGTFADYFTLAIQNPRITNFSHARVHDMVVTEDLFKGKIFGLEQPVSEIVEYFRASAQGLETRKRILMLMGPVGGGKSSIVTLIK